MMRKTAADWVPTRYVQTENTMSPEPHFRSSWSNLRKLRWHASLIMAMNPGVRLYVEKGRSWTNKRFNYDLYSISGNGFGMGAGDYDSVRDILTGIGIGIKIEQRMREEV